jgi:hypothetical protein
MGKKQGKQSKQSKQSTQSKQGRKKKFSWPMVVLGVMLLIAAAFIFANRRGVSEHGSGPPKIAVDQQKIDYGYVRYGVNKSFDLEVTNVGGAVLRFAERPYLEVLAGC